jgi:predicted  nucleic acid-binding Zn-ribbon protein
MNADGTASSTTPLEALMALQDEDLLADQLRHRLAHLPELAELAELDATVAALEQSDAPLVAERETLRTREAELEREIGECAARVATIEARLRDPSAGSFRDQQAMAAEIDSLATRTHQLEDSELEVMEALEPLEQALAASAGRREEIAARRGVVVGELAASRAAVGAELAAVEATRAPLAAAVPDGLRNEYEKLRTHLGGIGAARLVHGMCSGCNLSLAASELDQIRHATGEAIFHCEQCGRILVP